MGQNDLIDLVLKVLAGDDEAALVLSDFLLDAGGSRPLGSGVLVAITEKAVKRKGCERGPRVKLGRFAYVKPDESIDLFGTRSLGGKTTHEKWEKASDEPAATWQVIRPKQGKWVTVSAVYSRRFVMGEEAEYGSYNLVYTGPIVGISTKRITVDAHSTGNRGDVRCFDLEQFDGRNWDFDAVETVRTKTFTLMIRRYVPPEHRE